MKKLIVALLVSSFVFAGISSANSTNVLNSNTSLYISNLVEANLANRTKNLGALEKQAFYANFVNTVNNLMATGKYSGRNLEILIIARNAGNKGITNSGNNNSGNVSWNDSSTWGNNSGNNNSNSSNNSNNNNSGVVVTDSTKPTNNNSNNSSSNNNSSNNSNNNNSNSSTNSNYVYPNYTQKLSFSEDRKLILAGKSEKVGEFNIQAVNEAIRVERISIGFDRDLDNSVSGGKLYAGGQQIGTARRSHVTDSNVYFEIEKPFVIPENDMQIIVELETYGMGVGELGSPLTDIRMNSVEILRATGMDSGKSVRNSNNYVSGSGGSIQIESGGYLRISRLNENKNIFSIVPAIVNISVIDRFSSNTPYAKITVSANSGDNRTSSGNNTPDIVITGFDFYGSGTGSYKIYAENASTYEGNISQGGSFSQNSLRTQDLTLRNGNSKTFYIIPDTNNDGSGKTYNLRLNNNGISYRVEGLSDGGGYTYRTINNTLDLGYRSN